MVPLPAWAGAQGPDSDVVVAARARLARNLEGYPFPERASPEERQAVSRSIRRACRNEIGPTMEAMEIGRLSEGARAALVATQRISPDLAAAPGSWALLDSQGFASVFVNEEDHLRIQTFAPGNDPRAALERAEAIEAALGRSLRFCLDPRWGALTASLNNVGTGLRLSLLAHLPALGFLGTTALTLEAAATLDTAIRGLHGEGSQTRGDLFQVSNAVAFGRTAAQLAGRVEGVAEHLVAQERLARKTVASRFLARLARSLAAAQERILSAQELPEGEALGLLSLLRLAAATDQRSGPAAATFAELLVQLRTGSPVDGPRDRIARAALIRSAWRSGER